MNPSLISKIGALSNDPLGFVRFAYPWGKKGTELENEEGPNYFQKEVLETVADRLQRSNEPILLGTTSGHGVGKTALVSWLLDFAQSTFEDTKGVVTANTESQLRTKTWSEFAKWHRMSVTKSMFKFTATSRYSIDPNYKDTWRIDMVPWSERNTEAFAGLHNVGKRVVLIMDEASSIPDTIWEVAEGALTDINTQIMWFVFGNPTRAVGRFRACFSGGQFEKRWNTRKVDSRTVPQTNNNQIENWIKDYGIDHDFTRVRILGEFPRVDADSFISAEMAREAINRNVYVPLDEPVVLGVDVGRRGNNPSVIYPRRGRDARSIMPKIYPYMDNLMDLVQEVMMMYRKHAAEFVFVDGTGVGGGVVDRLLQLRCPVVEVKFGGRPDYNVEAQAKYANKRAEIWGSMREWLRKGSIPEFISGLDGPFIDELSAPLFGYNAQDEIQLEKKSDIWRRTSQSVDCADALACTFAYSNLLSDTPGKKRSWQTPVILPDYDPVTLEAIK